MGVGLRQKNREEALNKRRNQGNERITAEHVDPSGQYITQGGGDGETFAGGNGFQQGSNAGPSSNAHIDNPEDPVELQPETTVP